MVDLREDFDGFYNELSQRDLLIRAVADPVDDAVETTPPKTTSKEATTAAPTTTTPPKTTPKETTVAKTTTLSTLAAATTSKTTAATSASSVASVLSATASDPFSSIIPSTTIPITTGISSSSVLPSATQSVAASSDSSNNTGLIAGIAGGVGAIVVLGAFVFFMIRRNRRRASTRVSRTMDEMFSPTGGAETSNKKYTDYNSTGYEDQIASPNMAYMPANNAGAAGQYYASDYGYADNQQMYQHMDDSYSHGVVSPTMAQNNQLYRANTMMTAGAQQEQGMYYDAQQQHQLYYDSQPQMYHDQYYDSQQAYHDPQQQQAYHDPQQQQPYHDPQQQGYYDSHQQAYHDPQQDYGHQQSNYYPTEPQQSNVNANNHKH